MENILVFRTNIRGMEDVEKIADLIQQESRISRWNVDREDIDLVLRVEASEMQPAEVIRLIEAAGYFCEELPD